jgi:hypothetical protein
MRWTPRLAVELFLGCYNVSTIWLAGGRSQGGIGRMA